jgi:hypothetical protein
MLARFDEAIALEGAKIIRVEESSPMQVVNDIVDNPHGFL